MSKNKKEQFDFTTPKLVQWKTYELPHYASEVKQQLLWDLYTVYTTEYKKHIKAYWNSFLQNKIINFSHLGSTKHLKTKLNSSYLQICLAQSCSTLNQYTSAIELKLNDFLNHSTIKDSEVLHQLRTVNSTHSWLNSKNYYYKKIIPSIITDDFGNSVNLIDLRNTLEKEKIKTTNESVLLAQEKIINHDDKKLLIKNKIQKEKVVYKYYVDLNNKKCITDYGIEYTAKNKIEINKDIIKLSKKIFFNIVNKDRVSFPKTDKPRLVLDNRVINYIENKKSKSFDAWLSVSTLIPRKNALIPIKTHDYFNHASGILGNTIELNFNTFPYLIDKQKFKLPKNLKTTQTKTNQLIRVLMNKKTQVDSHNNFLEKYCNKKDINNLKPYELAFDIGLSTLFATSDGELLGQHWLDKLLQYDKKMTTLLADRQYIYSKTKEKNKRRQKQVDFTVRSPRYDALIRQIRGFIKTEINRTLNHYFEHKCMSLLGKGFLLKTVIVESLHFNNPNLSKKLNRMIKNFGLKLFKDKLDVLSKQYSFEVVEVNPAYSSKQCLKCDYVDARNRVKQKVFNCLCCGFTMNADIKAAKVLLKRFQQEAFSKCINVYSKTKEVLTELKDIFEGKIKTLLSCGYVARRKLMLLLYSNNNIFKNFVELKHGFIKPTSKALGLKSVSDYKLINSC
jgi:transposase